MIKGTLYTPIGKASGVATSKHADWIAIAFCLAIVMISAAVAAQIRFKQQEAQYC